MFESGPVLTLRTSHSKGSLPTFLPRSRPQVTTLEMFTKGDNPCHLQAPNPHDSVQIVGEPTINNIITTGVAGDGATVASLVNAAPRILKMPPGLVLMTDIGVPSYA